MVPVLTILSDGQVRHWREVEVPAAEKLGLTAEDFRDAFPSGKTRINDRVQWAITHLCQAGLLARPSRGHVSITARGRETLAEHSDRIDGKVLSQFAEYRDFLNRTKAGSGPAASTSASGSPAETPHDAIAEAARESNEALAAEVLQRVLDQPPVFLERLVLRLLNAMGYGGRAGAIERWGKSGDGGIDGVVRQDALGLDQVYVQAKRYAPERAVGRPGIQAFVGALHGQQADRGVFITTSRFSVDARDYVERIPDRIVLIDGHRLAELMILHNVGVQDETTVVLKRIDEDFFDEN